jgi:tyrosyl-tRNA synthetase
VPSVDEQLRELCRGVAEIHQLDELRARLERGKPLKVKAGFDPTRPDLHLGHTVLMRKMRQFQDFGHELIFLIGDVTALVGDPTGQNDARPRLSREQVDQAALTYQEQAFKILDRERTTVRHNSEWLRQLSLEQVIELAAKRTVARTLERRDFRERFEQQRDIHLHEFLYPLLQGYDSVALECDVELGGTDQLFNLMVGRDLMQRYGQPPQIVMTVPLLEGIDARVREEDGRIIGKKMSKSADNYVGISEPPLEILRKLMQLDDGVVWRYFELLSAEPMAAIDALRANASPLEAKRHFALEIITQYHGAAAAEAAWSEFSSTYLGEGVPSDVAEIELRTSGATLWLAKALTGAQLAPSTSEARRLIAGGAVEVDGRRVDDEQHQLDQGGRYLLRVGSKKRRFCWVVVA